MCLPSRLVRPLGRYRPQSPPDVVVRKMVVPINPLLTYTFKPGVGSLRVRQVFEVKITDN